MQKGELLYKGKAKSLYLTNDPELLIADFRDDTTAFDGGKCEQLSQKGQTNNLISEYIMAQLEAAGIKTHFVKRLSDHESLVKRLTMLPIECVVRNIAAGSLCRRLGIPSGLKLSSPLFEFFLKNDELHDPMICREHALAFSWATAEQLDGMQQASLAINAVLRQLFSDAGLILVDAKFEFGMAEGQLYLGDEISPDSCRVWDALTNESLDKDRFRKDLGGVVESYQQIAERLGIKLPA